MTSGISVGVLVRQLSAPFSAGATGAKLLLFNCLVGYCGSAAAGFLNSYCMRMSEMNRGIKVFDEDGKERGVSKLAAMRAVMETAQSRIILAMPTFLIPAMITTVLEKARLLPKRGAARTVADITILAFALWHAIPIAVAVFPQTSEINSSALEEEFRAIKNGRGETVDRFFYNKGL